jgi:hypothetical protein
MMSKVHIIHGNARLRIEVVGVEMEVALAGYHSFTYHICFYSSCGIYIISLLVLVSYYYYYYYY